MTRESRGPWYLLTGLILGFVVGLMYTWVFSPTEYVDTHPDALRPDYKDAYRAAIASAYSVTGDMTRAKARLALLNDEEPATILAAQSQRYLAEGYSYDAALALARLSADLGEAPASAPRTATSSPAPSETPFPEVTATEEAEEELTPSETVETPIETTTPEVTEEDLPATTPTAAASLTATQTRTPILTFTPLPTRTPTPTLAPPFVLREQALLCDPEMGDAVIEIVVQNALGEGIPGVEIIIHWDGQEEHFFSGLKPEMGWGYADYSMTPEVNYTLHIGEGGEAVDLFVPECSDDQGERYWGGWRLIFAHP